MVSEPANQKGRSALKTWQEAIKENPFTSDRDFRHSVSYYLKGRYQAIEQELQDFAHLVIHQIEPLVAENNRPENLPKVAHYDGIGCRVEKIRHHPSYEACGDFIYGSRLLERASRPGGLVESLAFFFLSSQAGEAGHNCPIACSYGLIRILQKVEDFPNKEFYLQQLIKPSYKKNYTAAQFVTEVQGGSDVGQNAVTAYQDDHGQWKISGEKWFCSNANAELMLVTARYDQDIEGTKGLGLFLIPATTNDEEPNSYTFRLLKDKLGTRTLATAEIDFHCAAAIPMGKPEEGFKLLMENVLHASRIFNTMCVLGMARRAYAIARAYAEHRLAFGSPIIRFPLVQESLARIKSENSALLASIFATARLQDAYDTGNAQGRETKLLLRLLANLNKHLSALWTVEHIHHSLDILAGNGTIETFSSIPLLLRDSIICENWEGTHNVLNMQLLKDIQRYDIDAIFFESMKKTLQNIGDNSSYKGVFENLLTDLEEETQELKQASKPYQSLWIQDISRKMGVLFAGVHLLLEAEDQKDQGSESKLHCLAFFLHLHAYKQPKARVLELTRQVLYPDL